MVAYQKLFKGCFHILELVRGDSCIKEDDHITAFVPCNSCYVDDFRFVYPTYVMNIDVAPSVDTFLRPWRWCKSISCVVEVCDVDVFQREWW